MVQTLTQAINAANAYATTLRTYNTAVARLYRYSARWPANTQVELQERVQAAKK